MSDRMHAELRQRARREFAGNVLLKFTLLLVSVLAIGTIVLLDQLKSHLNETKRKPYSYKTVETHLTTGSDPKLKAEMDVLAAALKEVRSDSSFASTDEAFAAIYEHAAPEKTRRAEELEIRARYAAALAEVNSALTNLLAANPRPDSFDKDFAKQFGVRTSLISARAVELQESQQAATTIRTVLKEAWDRSNPSQAKVPFAYFGVNALDAASRHIADPADPLSIIYDVLWYAALIIGVLTFAALVLAPVFRAVPLTGADDSFGERLRSLLARAPRALSTGSSLLAGAIGTAAIIGASAALPSSPLKETGFVPPRVEEPAPPDDQKKDPLPDKQPPPTDPLATIRNDITEIRNTISAHETSSTTHANLIPPPQPPDDRAVTRIIELAENVENTVGGLNDQISQRDAAIARQIDNSRTAIERKVAAVETRTQNVETQLAGAGTKIDARASAVESTVILPHMLGERPSFLAATLGFDRYEVTPATTEFLKKLGAPPEVERAVATLGSTRYSNDELRLALRAELCKPVSHNCELYLAWRNTVLRAARSK